MHSKKLKLTFRENHFFKRTCFVSKMWNGGSLVQRILKTIFQWDGFLHRRCPRNRNGISTIAHKIHREEELLKYVNNDIF
jgi:hypothetical protein